MLEVASSHLQPTGDTGMFHSWNSDYKYLTEHLSSALPVNNTIELKLHQKKSIVLVFRPLKTQLD